jgi:hypothetical protein
MFAWTDETRKFAVDTYKERIAEYSADEQPNVSQEIVKEIADELGCTTNGVKTVLMKNTDEDGNIVYVSKAAAKKSTSASSGTSGAGKRRGKAESHADLIAAISAMVGDDNVNSEIISKLTGKAADYFTHVLVTIQEQM